MDVCALRDTLCEGPPVALLGSLVSNRDSKVILPLLDAELQRSISRTHRLREHRNKIASPFYRLPPEVIEMVFYTYARENNELFNMRWVRLLRVCRHWYNILVNFPRLWSFMDVLLQNRKRSSDAMDLRRLAAQQSRTGLYPLTVAIRTNSYASVSTEKKKFISSSFYNPESLASLTVEGSSALICAILPKLAADRHPRLGELTLQHKVAKSGWHCNEKQAELRSLVNLVLREEARTPMLRHLTTIGVYFDWTFVRKLHTLSVDYSHHTLLEDAGRLFDGMVDALPRCPSLERLHIRFPSVYPDAVIPMGGVPLPNLRFLSLDGADILCHSLLQSLVDLSPSARIIISAPNGDRKVRYTSPVVSLLGRHVCRKRGPDIRTVVLSYGLMFRDGASILPLWRLGAVGRVNPEASVDEWNGHSFLQAHRDNEASYIGVEATVEGLSVNGVIESFVGDVFKTWPLSEVAYLDLRRARLAQREVREALVSQTSIATTVIIRPESETAHYLIEALRTHLRVRRERVFANIIFDAQRAYRRRRVVETDTLGAEYARDSVTLALKYCKEVARVGDPLDTIEIINERPASAGLPLLGPPTEFDCDDVCKHLRDGFIQTGVLHSVHRGLNGLEVKFPRDFRSH